MGKIRFKSAILLLGMLLIFPVASFAISSISTGGSIRPTINPYLSISIIIILLVIIVSNVSTLVHIKSAIANRLIRKSKANDGIWNDDIIKTISKDIFFQIKNGISLKSIEHLKPRVTDQTYTQFSDHIEHLNQNNMRTRFTYLDVKLIEITGVQDYIDDSRDKVDVYMEGEYVYYRLNTLSNTLIDESENDVRWFGCMLSFIRKEDKWILECLNEDVKLENMLNSRNRIQN